MPSNLVSSPSYTFPGKLGIALMRVLGHISAHFIHIIYSVYSVVYIGRALYYNGVFKLGNLLLYVLDLN